MTMVLTQAPAVSLTSLLDAARAAERSGAMDEALAQYECAFRLLPAAGDAAAAADVLRWIGTVHRERGDTELAFELYEASLAVAEAADIPLRVASALNCLAIVEQFRANIEEAVDLYARAHVLADKAGDERLCAMIDQNLGTISNIRGDVSTALRYYTSALARFEGLGDSQAACWALNNMAMANVDLRDWARADECFDRAFDMSEQARDTAMLGRIELGRAELHLKQGAHARARACCDRAVEIFGRLDSRLWQAEAFKFYGVLYRDMRMPTLAETNFRQAVELSDACDDRLLEAEVHAEWALLHLAEDRNVEALTSLNRAHALFGQMRAGPALLDVEKRMDQLEATYMRVVRQWGESIESKDLYTAGHCQRVADYACLLASHMGISGRDLEWFRMGAFLHDVGKTAVPAEVLNKPGKLTAEEWALMQSHTTVGDAIVAPLNFPWDIRPVVRNHHERWDGNGYPDGLAGEDIPLTARILCVADVYDALTTARSYRPALPHEEAMRIMERDSGTLLDPTIFALFQQLMRQQAIAA